MNLVTLLENFVSSINLVLHESVHKYLVSDGSLLINIGCIKLKGFDVSLEFVEYYAKFDFK